MLFAWVSLFCVGVDRPLRPAGLPWASIRDCEDLLMATDEYETHEYDVVVIGAGGAGPARRDRGRARRARGRRSSASRCSARRTP